LIGGSRGHSIGSAGSANHISVTGTVIAMEEPEFGWPMEYQSLKIFYLRVDKIAQGREKAKYLRVAYGYNPTRQPETVLPDEMFSGNSVWKLRLIRRDIFDRTVEVSQEPLDWYDEEHSGEVEGQIEVPIRPKCIPTSGNEKEAQSLEKLGKVKGYWLARGRLERMDAP